jgi:hypothetical protein
MRGQSTSKALGFAECRFPDSTLLCPCGFVARGGVAPPLPSRPGHAYPAGDYSPHLKDDTGSPPPTPMLPVGEGNLPAPVSRDFMLFHNDPRAADPSVPSSMTIAASCDNFCDSQPCMDRRDI